MSMPFHLGWPVCQEMLEIYKVKEVIYEVKEVSFSTSNNLACKSKEEGNKVGGTKDEQKSCIWNASG